MILKIPRKTQLEYTEKVIAELKTKILKNEKAIKKSQPEDSMECCYLLSALKGTVLIRFWRPKIFEIQLGVVSDNVSIEIAH